MRVGLLALAGLVAAAGGASALDHGGLVDVWQEICLPGSGIDFQPNVCVIVGASSDPTLGLNMSTMVIEGCPLGQGGDTDFPGLAFIVFAGVPDGPRAGAAQATMVCAAADAGAGTAQLDAGQFAGVGARPFTDNGEGATCGASIASPRQLYVTADAREPRVSLRTLQGVCVEGGGPMMLPSVLHGAEACAITGGSLPTTGVRAVIDGYPLQAGGGC